MLKEVHIDNQAKGRLVKKLESMPNVISFSEYPAIASLCSCLGIGFELGSSDYDRLSPYLGFDLSQESTPWNQRFIQRDGELGIELTRKDKKPIVPRSKELARVLDFESLGSDGSMTKAVIFPNLIAKIMKTEGFDLVIVRDWILRSALGEFTSKSLNYLQVNSWELESNIAMTQLSLAENRQLAFFGTHDIVDHIFHANIDQHQQNHKMVLETKKTFLKEFQNQETKDIAKLTIAYLGAVILDDLAQPAWYSSKPHQIVLKWVNTNLPAIKSYQKRPTNYDVPNIFHEMVSLIRSGSFQLEKFQSTFKKLCFEVCWM